LRKKKQYKLRKKTKSAYFRIPKINTIMRAAAQIIAYIFHPLNIPLIGMTLLMYVSSTPRTFLVADSFYHISTELKIMLLVLFAMLTWFAPIITVFFLKKSGDIITYEMENREERNVPISFMLFFYILFFALIHYYIPKHVIPTSTNAILLAACIGLFIARLANNTLKISLHSLGMGMLSGATYVYYTTLSYYPEWVIPSVFLLSGIVVSSRIYLGKHDLKESLYGYALGFGAQLLASIILF